VPLSDCRTNSVIRGEIAKGNLSPLHCGNYARCVPSQEEDGQSKNPEKERGERNTNGDLQVDCRRWEKIAESNLCFFGG